jgi:hypothetical protein
MRAVTDRPEYDRIGRLYSLHRRPEPRIAAQISGALGDASTVVNVGAGTGSYEPADRTVVAVEPSPVMISQRPLGAAPVVQAVAEALPMPSGSFDAALAVFTVHHWTDVRAGLGEITRVARRIVILTFDPVVHATFWLLKEYLPESNELPSCRAPAPEVLAELIGAHRIEEVPVPADCVDGFNWAYWNRPEAYLDPEVRACISGLAQLPDALVQERMEKLRADLDDGSWHRRHGHLLGDATIDGGFRLVIRE